MGLSLWLHQRERLLTDAKALKRLNSAIRAGDKTFQETISTCDVKLHWDFLAVRLHASRTVIQLQMHSRSYKRATVFCLIHDCMSLLVPGWSIVHTALIEAINVNQMIPPPTQHLNWYNHLNCPSFFAFKSMFRLMMPFLTLELCCSNAVSTKNNFSATILSPPAPFESCNFCSLPPQAVHRPVGSSQD